MGTVCVSVDKEEGGGERERERGKERKEERSREGERIT